MKIFKKTKILILVAGLFLLAGSVYFYQVNFQTLFREKVNIFSQSFSETCEQRNDWRRCFDTQLGEFNKTNSLKQTLSVLREVQKIDPKVKDCHFIAHFISSSEVEKAPDKWLDVFNLVDQTSCNNGYVHGVMEGRSRFDTNFEIKASVIPETCQSIEDRINQRLG